MVAFTTHEMKYLHCLDSINWYYLCTGYHNHMVVTPY